MFFLTTIAGDGIAGVVYPVEVATKTFGHGTRLTDARGFTLYQYDNDKTKPGTSTCNDDCAVLRPPLIVADAEPAIPENWSVVNRDDGTRQWAYKGMPLYRYARDSHEAAAFGAGDGWVIAFEPIVTPPEITVAETVLGHVLAAASGKTLYFRAGAAAPQDCNAECLKRWQPLEAPWGAIDHGDFSVEASADGVYQWVYQGKSLFIYAGDTERGDTRGDGVEDIWKALILEPAPAVPDWIKVVASDGGDLYANSDGMTLYMFLEDQNATEQAYLGGNHCDPGCLSKYWDPVRVDSKLPPVGDWSVIERDGALQWAYLGRPVYTLKLETRPGQLFYTTFRQFQWMKPIMYSLPALQGVF